MSEEQRPGSDDRSGTERAAPAAEPRKRHGDALQDGSGSRQGEADGGRHHDRDPEGGTQRG